VAIANARFYRAQEERNLGLVRGMMALIESRDSYAKGSTERVVRYVTAVARLLNYPKDQLKSLIYGAVLRDIGMITVSGLILKNPAHLSEGRVGADQAAPDSGRSDPRGDEFPEGSDRSRHEPPRTLGRGRLSDRAQGHDIPLGARIVSLVDAYVAMTSERPYRRSLPYEKARQVIAENWGTPFDPAIVDVFLDVLEKIEKRSRLRAGDARRRPESDPNRPAEPAELDPLSAGATIPRALGDPPVSAESLRPALDAGAAKDEALDPRRGRRPRVVDPAPDLAHAERLQGEHRDDRGKTDSIRSGVKRPTS
jgi:hypothetical protein